MIDSHYSNEFYPGYEFSSQCRIFIAVMNFYHIYEFFFTAMNFITVMNFHHNDEISLEQQSNEVSSQ